MNRRCRIAQLTAAFALCAAAPAAAAIEPCFKNHYILDEPCALDWTPVNTGLTDLDVHVLAVDPVKKSTLYAGGPSGVFKSSDGGASWSKTGLIIKTETAANYPLPVGRGGPMGPPPSFVAASIVAHLAIDPVNPDNLYAATIRSSGCAFYQRRVFKSVDGGESWSDRVSPGINGCDNIHSLVLAPTDPDTVYLINFDDLTGDTWSPIVRSTNGAGDWTYLGYPVLNVLAVDPLDSATLYAGTFDWEPWFTDLPNGVLKSSDGGATWAATGLTGMGITALAVLPGKTRTVYAAAVQRGVWSVFPVLFKSVDGGARWRAINVTGTTGSVSTILVDSDDPAIIYLGMSGGGVLRSLDAGATWESFNNGLHSLTIRSLALAAGSPKVLYAGTPAGVFRITDPAAR